MHKHVALVAVLAGCLVAGSAAQPMQAAEPARSAERDHEMEVTEAEFLAPLDFWEAAPGEVPSDPAARALRADLGAARARWLAARTLANPELGLAYEGEGSGSAADGSQTEVRVGWQPPRPDRRRLQIEAAAAGVEAARVRLALDLVELRSAWREAFARWAVATVRAARLDSHAASLRELAERSVRRAEAGEDSGLEARRLLLAAAVVEAEHGRAEAVRLEARAAARAWRPDLSREAVPRLPALPPRADAAAAVAPATVAALEAVLEEARLEAEAAEKVWSLPRLDAGWQRQEVGGQEVDRPLLGLSWSVPVLDRQRSRQVAARARVESLAARLELARRRWDAELAAAREAYGQLRRAAGEAAAASEEGPPAVAAATAAFAAGELELTALLETLAADRAARAAALDLVEAALAAHRRLERLEAPVPAEPGPDSSDLSLPGPSLPGPSLSGPGAPGPSLPDTDHESEGDTP